MKLIFLLAAVLLSGCAILENRAACSPDGKRLYFLSMYTMVTGSPLGIASFVREEDSTVLCKPMVSDQ